MMTITNRWISKILQALAVKGKILNAQSDPPREKIYQEVEDAKKEWLYAKAYFNAVTEPELIDHAIFAIEAAEKKYIYLWRRIREGFPAEERYQRIG